MIDQNELYTCQFDGVPTRLENLHHDKALERNQDEIDPSRKAARVFPCSVLTNTYKFSDEQIPFTLSHIEAGTHVAVV